jgi:hypothetical protein
MGWEYRVSKEIQTHKYRHYDPKIVYGIKNVFVDENGDISHIASMPLFMADSIDELKIEIQNMLQACDGPMIDYNTGE